VTDLKKRAEILGKPIKPVEPRHPWHSCYYCQNLIVDRCSIFDDKVPEDFQVKKNYCEYWDEALPWAWP
jgi:hypothetical protein